MARNPKGLKLDKKEIKQVIDIDSALGGEGKFRVKKEFLKRCEEYIKQRTLDGKDVHGKEFKSYTKEYAEKKGVGINEVNLRLKGDMLRALDTKAKRDGTGEIVIKGKKEKLKTYNHMTPKSNANPLPQRKYFGLTSKELKRIAREIKQEVKDWKRD